MSVGNRIIVLDRGIEKREIAAMGCCAAPNSPVMK